MQGFQNKSVTACVPPANYNVAGYSVQSNQLATNKLHLVSSQPPSLQVTNRTEHFWNSWHVLFWLCVWDKHIIGIELNCNFIRNEAWYKIHVLVKPFVIIRNTLHIV